MQQWNHPKFTKRLLIFWGSLRAWRSCPVASQRALAKLVDLNSRSTAGDPLVSCVNWGNPTMDTHWHRCSFPSSHQSWPYKMLCILHPECQMLCWHPVSNMIKSVELHYRSLPSPKHNNPAEKEGQVDIKGRCWKLFDTINEANARLEPSKIPGESCQVPKHSWAALQNHVPGNMNESCHPSHVLGTTLVVVSSLRAS